MDVSLNSRLEGNKEEEEGSGFRVEGLGLEEVDDGRKAPLVNNVDPRLVVHRHLRQAVCERESETDSVCESE